MSLGAGMIGSRSNDPDPGFFGRAVLLVGGRGGCGGGAGCGGTGRGGLAFTGRAGGMIAPFGRGSLLFSVGLGASPKSKSSSNSSLRSGLLAPAGAPKRHELALGLVVT